MLCGDGALPRPSGAKPRCHANLGLRVESALEEVPRACTSQELVCFHYYPAARQHGVGHSCDLNSLEHRIVDAHVVSLRADRVLAVWIKDHQIRVTANCDRALARIETKEFRRRRGNEFHKAVHTEPPSGNAAGIDKAHAVLDSGTAVRYFGKIVAAQFLLLLETERTVIGR